jgi:hypothetical protein
MMPGRIARRIRFRFHNAPADPPRRQFVHYHFSNQKTRQLNRIEGQFRSPQTPDDAFVDKMFLSTHEIIYANRNVAVRLCEPQTANL